MTDQVFTDLELAAEFVGEGEHPTDPLRVTATAAETADPEQWNEGNGERIMPFVTLWDDSPPPTGGGWFGFTIAQARHLGEALIRAADHAQRAKDEALRRGWKLVE